MWRHGERSGLSNLGKQKRDVMKDIRIAKLTQNKDCRRTPLDIGDKMLAAAYGRDHWFGIGIPVMHPDVPNPDKWVQMVII